MPLGRRARGLLGTALIWAVASAVLYVGVLLNLYPLVKVSGHALALGAVGAAGWGAIAGLVFGVFVIALAQRRALEELSPRRFAAWGLAAGLGSAVMVVTGYLALYGAPSGGWASVAAWLGAGGLAGVVTAATSLRAARRPLALPDARGAQRLPPVA